MDCLRMLFLSAVLLIGFTSDANCLTVDFEGVASDGSTYFPENSYHEKGFILDAQGDYDFFGIFSSTFPPASGYNSNGTDVFGWAGYDSVDGIPHQIFDITSAGGNPFTMVSIDASNLWENEFYPGTTLEVIGYYSPAESVTDSFALTQNQWTTFYFDSRFSNIIFLE